jgi:hypothetical protein
MQSNQISTSSSVIIRVTHQIRNQSSTTNISNSLLRGFRLLLSLDYRNERDVNLQKVSFARASSQLSHALDEWRTLDITHCASQLNDTHIR